MRLLLLLILWIVGSDVILAGDPRIKSPEISTDNGPEALAAAVEQGKQTALADIKGGHPVILYYGLPWSVGKPFVDDTTRLPVVVVAGCTVTGCFSTEVKAYNDTVRAWAEKRH